MNKVELSLIISNDQNNQDGTVRSAVKKVTDKLTTVQTFMPGRKQQDGTYGPSASLTVRVTTATKIAGVALEPKAHIDVTGFFVPESVPESYTDKKGKTRSYFVLVANEITETKRTNEASAPAANTGTSVPEASTPAQTAAPAPTQTQAPVNTAAAAVEDDDLPFL